MKALIKVVPIILLLIACSKNEKKEFNGYAGGELELNKIEVVNNPVIDTNVVGGIYISRSADISFVDKHGNDLLNPDNPNGFKKQSLKLYYLEEGLKKEVYFPHYDAPRNIDLFCEREFCELRKVVSHTTYLEFEPGVEDIIESEFIKNGGSILVSKIYYNGELKWDIDSGAPAFTIVK